MARDRGRRTISLDDEAHALLDGVGNISEYVGKLVVQHGRDWTECLAYLMERGWRSQELLAACEALAGHALFNAGRNGAFLAAALDDREAVESCFSSSGVSAARRRHCLNQVARDHAVAYALAAIAREYNLPNENCRRAVRTWELART